MSRSCFIQNSERPAALRAQFRKLKDDLRGSGLFLEGPFRDQSDAISALGGDVNSRMKFGSYGSIVGAAIATLAPQNIPYGEHSWLKVPFAVSPGNEAAGCESAGSVADSEAMVTDMGRFRVTDLEGITLVGVAVLRRLEIPSFFAYMHFDMGNPTLQALRSLSCLIGSVPVGEPVPSILTLNPEPEFFSLLPPYALPLPAPRGVMGFEVLDDSAVKSMVQIRSAHGNSIRLMRDSAGRKAEDYYEVFQRAMGIGHALFSGMNGWSEAEAARDLAFSAAILNPASGTIGMESVRSHLEKTLVQDLTIPERHSILASSVMLDKGTSSALRDAVLRARKAPRQGEEGVRVPVQGVGNLLRLMAYMRISETMREHVHPRQECPAILSMN